MVKKAAFPVCRPYLHNILTRWARCRRLGWALPKAKCNNPRATIIYSRFLASSVHPSISRRWSLPRDTTLSISIFDRNLLVTFL